MLAADYDTRLGSEPKVVAVANGDGADGVRYWIIWTGVRAGAIGIDEAGLIKVVDDGCSGAVNEILAKHTDYLYRAN